MKIKRTFEQFAYSNMSKGNEQMQTQENYRDSFFAYYKNNIDTLNKNVDYKNVRIDFRFASQVIIAEDGTKMVLFPLVAYNKVEEIVVAKISENEEFIEFDFHLPPNLPIGGSGGGGNPPAAPVVLGPDKTIPNIGQFLSCLNLNQPANLTIFARAGTLSPLDVGHAFIFLKVQIP